MPNFRSWQFLQVTAHRRVLWFSALSQWGVIHLCQSHYVTHRSHIFKWRLTSLQPLAHIKNNIFPFKITLRTMHQIYQGEWNYRNSTGGRCEMLKINIFSLQERTSNSVRLAGCFCHVQPLRLFSEHVWEQQRSPEIIVSIILSHTNVPMCHTAWDLCARKNLS